MNSPRAANLLRLAIPAALVGAGSAITLIILSVLSNRLEGLLWDTTPDGLDVDPRAGRPGDLADDVFEFDIIGEVKAFELGLCAGAQLFMISRSAVAHDA